MLRVLIAIVPRVELLGFLITSKGSEASSFAMASSAPDDTLEPDPFHPMRSPPTTLDSLHHTKKHNRISIEEAAAAEDPDDQEPPSPTHLGFKYVPTPLFVLSYP